MYGTEVGIKDRIIYEKNAKVEEMIKEKTEIELRHSSENGFPQFPMDSLPKE